MKHTVSATVEVEAEIQAPQARVQLLHYRFFQPPRGNLTPEGYRLDFCLTGRHRSTRASYIDTWGGRRFERVGDLFLAHRDDGMVITSDETSPLTSIVCEIRREALLAMLDEIPDLTDRHWLAGLDIRDARMRGLMLQLAEEARSPGFASHLLVDLIAQQLAIELHRYGAEFARRQISGGLAGWQLRVIEERLDELGAPPSLQELAMLCKLSTRQLTRAFRASRGSSVGAYVALSQIEHAKRLLGIGMSLTAIAERLGFSSASNFCSAFRRANGVTPGQFRDSLLR